VRGLFANVIVFFCSAFFFMARTVPPRGHRPLQVLQVMSLHSRDPFFPSFDLQAGPSFGRKGFSILTFFLFFTVFPLFPRPLRSFFRPPTTIRLPLVLDFSGLFPFPAPLPSGILTLDPPDLLRSVVKQCGPSYSSTLRLFHVFPPRSFAQGGRP